MPLPTPLLRKNPKAYKNQFGHVLVLAGSRRMLGASALCGLSAMRSGAGLTTLGVPKSLNTTLQKKISPVIMTWPLAETPQQSFAATAWRNVNKDIKNFQAIAIGPGLSHDASTKKFAHHVIKNSVIPLVIDADALNALVGKQDVLLQSDAIKILTPHVGEFERLTMYHGPWTMDKKKKAALQFAQKYHCFLILKSDRTIVAAPNGKTYTNRTGNAGMATAGSGDVLTGIIAAFLAQGLSPFDAAKWGVYLHGKAGDLAAKKISKISMIATDIIDNIPLTLKDEG